MKENYNYIIRDRIVKNSFILSLGILFISFIYIAVLYRRLPPFIPLYNQLTWGLQRLGEKYLFFLPLVISTAILFINFIFAQLNYTKMPLVVRMISVTTLFISIIICIFIIRTALLVL